MYRTSPRNSNRLIIKKTSPKRKSMSPRKQKNVKSYIQTSPSKKKFVKTSPRKIKLSPFAKVKSPKNKSVKNKQRKTSPILRFPLHAKKWSNVHIQPQPRVINQKIKQMLKNGYYVRNEKGKYEKMYGDPPQYVKKVYIKRLTPTIKGHALYRIYDENDHLIPVHQVYLE